MGDVVEKRHHCKQEEESRKPELRSPQLRGVVKAQIPANENQLRKEKGEQVQHAPVLEVRQRQDAEIQEQNVSEESVLIVFSGAEQRGCHEPADRRKNCDGLRVITNRHDYRSHSDENHQEQGGYLVQQMIEAEGRKNGKIQNRNAASENRHRVPTHFFAVQPLSPGNKSQAGQHPDHYAAGFTNPLVVDGVLQKISHPENDGSHAYLV